VNGRIRKWKMEWNKRINKTNDNRLVKIARSKSSIDKRSLDRPRKTWRDDIIKNERLKKKKKHVSYSPGWLYSCSARIESFVEQCQMMEGGRTRKTSLAAMIRVILAWFCLMTKAAQPFPRRSSVADRGDSNANSRSHRDVQLGMFTRGRNDNNRKRIERRVHYRATVARNLVCRSRLTGADAGKLAAISGTLSAATHHGAIP